MSSVHVDQLMNEEARSSMPGTELRRNTSDNSSTYQEPASRPPPPSYPPAPPQPQYPQMPVNTHAAMRPMPGQPMYGPPMGVPMTGQPMHPPYMYPMGSMHAMPPGAHPGYYMNPAMNRVPGPSPSAGYVENPPSSGQNAAVFSKILNLVKKK